LQAGRSVGCLVIDDPNSTGGVLAALTGRLQARGVTASRFDITWTEPLYTELQRAYQRVRRDDAVNCLVAGGAGCGCALALASQLPVDRLALVDPFDWRGTGPLRRIHRYADRGAALCVCDVLILPGSHTVRGYAERLRRELCNCGVQFLSPAAPGENRSRWETSILHFLRDGVWPQSLA